MSKGFAWVLTGFFFLAGVPSFADKAGHSAQVRLQREALEKNVKAFTKAHESSSAYWGMGTKKNGSNELLGSILVIGNKVFDKEKAVVTDDQYYVALTSQGISVAHYTYIFEAPRTENKGVMKVLEDGKSVGEGSYECSPSKLLCAYEYTVGGEVSTGTDFIGSPNLVYSEVSETRSPSKKEPQTFSIERFRAEYFPLTDRALSDLKTQFGIK